MSKISKFFLILCVIGVIAYAWFTLNKNSGSTTKSKLSEPTSSSVSVKRTKTYMSSTYGFSFSYPDSLDIKEFSPERISIGTKGIAVFKNLVDISIIKGGPDNKAQSFEEFVLDESRLACSSITIASSLYCTRIDDVFSIKPFTSSAGGSGQVFYLKAEGKKVSTGISVSERRGPFYTFNTSSFTPNMMSFLLINGSEDKDSSELDLYVIGVIVNSVLIKGSDSN